MKIMVIEDDMALAGEIGFALGRWGYETAIPEKFDDIVEEFTRCRPQL